MITQLKSSISSWVSVLLHVLRDIIIVIVSLYFREPAEGVNRSFIRPFPELLR